MSAAKILNEEKINYIMAFPFGSGYLSLDFSKLGELGGVGTKILLGILIHPEYGSWISLREATATDLEPSRYNEPLYPFNPCPPCSKPYIFACPYGIEHQYSREQLTYHHKFVLKNSIKYEEKM
ncbi:MAG: hypothetical protein L0Y68_10065 [Candidatus Dadabacteria bacterium]|nr:hypothetical protein [Candidatus Dadabacteria bacterium]